MVANEEIINTIQQRTTEVRQNTVHGSVWNTSQAISLLPAYRIFFEQRGPIDPMEDTLAASKEVGFAEI